MYTFFGLQGSEFVCAYNFLPYWTVTFFGPYFLVMTLQFIVALIYLLRLFFTGMLKLESPP